VYFLHFSKLTLVVLSLLLIFTARPTFADTTKIEEVFPESVGSLHRIRLPGAPDVLVSQGVLIPAEGIVCGQVEYANNKSEKFLVEVVRFHQEADAYSLLTMVAVAERANNKKIELTSDYGTSSFSTTDEIVFFRGLEFVRVTRLSKTNNVAIDAFAKSFSEMIDKGEADIPALVKHLPDAEQSLKTALFLPRFTGVQRLLPNQTVLSSIETQGDADAAYVQTASGKVLIVEYHTPQLAKDNDERIIAKIHELWKLGQPAPIGYRRVGNYSVFVFDAPDEATAKQLMDQVKYEQVVQWLGDNPNILKEAERRYVQTTLGVFIAVLKASGFALVACLGLGGLIGALLFSRRRARQTALEAYSDAGGMLRLNLDQMTPQTDPARLLGPGH
jgi:hypothetical protein